MAETFTTAELLSLPAEQRLELIEALWDSLDGATVDGIGMPEWHRQILDARLAAHEADPAAAQPWREAKAEILESLKR